jgi:hypothetical protein
LRPLLNKPAQQNLHWDSWSPISRPASPPPSARLPGPCTQLFNLPHLPFRLLREQSSIYTTPACLPAPLPFHRTQICTSLPRLPRRRTSLRSGTPSGLAPSWRMWCSMRRPAWLTTTTSEAVAVQGTAWAGGGSVCWAGLFAGRGCLPGRPHRLLPFCQLGWAGSPLHSPGPLLPLVLAAQSIPLVRSRTSLSLHLPAPAAPSPRTRGPPTPSSTSRTPRSPAWAATPRTSSCCAATPLACCRPSAS